MCTIFQKFDLYDAIIAHDYMRHEAITAGVRGVLAGCAQPLRVLDVGCGHGELIGYLTQSKGADARGIEHGIDGVLGRRIGRAGDVRNQPTDPGLPEGDNT